MKSVLITNLVIKVIFIISITVLAISFNNLNILWWFLMLPLLGYTYKETPINKGGADNG